MTRNNALRGLACLIVLLAAIPLGPLFNATATGLLVGIRAPEIVGGGPLGDWAISMYLAGHPEVATYSAWATIAILIGLAVLVSKIFVAIWGNKIEVETDAEPVRNSAIRTIVVCVVTLAIPILMILMESNFRKSVPLAANPTASTAPSAPAKSVASCTRSVAFKDCR